MVRRGASLALVFLAGCQVTSEDIGRWKNTEQGPEKIRKALEDSAAPLSVRGEALSALAELGMSEEIDATMKKMAPADRKAVLGSGALPRIIEIAQGKEPGAPPSRGMRNAKDALFILRFYLDGSERNQVDQALGQWVAADLAVRMTAGSVGAEKIFAAMGPAAAGPMLARLALSPGPNQTHALALLSRMGDRASKDKVASEWVKRARAEKPVRPETLLALGRLGGEVARDYLVEMIMAKTGPVDTRRAAIQGLQSDLNAHVLEVAFEIARNSKEPALLREDAFGLMERIPGAATVAKLIELLAERDLTVARRSLEAAVTVGGPQSLVPILERVDLRLVPESADLRDFLLRYVVALGPKARPSLRKALDSKSPLARLVAILALGEIGTQEDAPALEKVSSDSAKVPVRGVAGGATIGAQSRQVFDKLKKKR